MKMLPNKRWLSKELLSGKKKRGLWNWENHLTPGFTTHQLGLVQFSSVQSHSPVELFVIPWTAAHQASLSITNSWSLLKLMFIEPVMPSNHLIFCCPLLLPPSIFPSIRVFSNESVLHIRWHQYWSFSFNINAFNEYSGLISFRMDGLDLLAVQGTLKSLLQHHSSKASFLRCSAFFTVQLSHSYMATGKTIAFTRWTFVGKVTSLFFNMLSRLSIAFYPRSKYLLISWPQSPSAVILEPKKIKSVTVYIVSPSICHEVMELDAMILVFWMLSSKPTFSFSSFTFIKRLFSGWTWTIHFSLLSLPSLFYLHNGNSETFLAYVTRLLEEVHVRPHSKLRLSKGQESHKISSVLYLSYFLPLPHNF